MVVDYWIDTDKSGDIVTPEIEKTTPFLNYQWTPAVILSSYPTRYTTVSHLICIIVIERSGSQKVTILLGRLEE